MAAITDQHQADERPLACAMTAGAPLGRTGDQALVALLVAGSAEEVRELLAGYAWRFAGECYPEVAAFVADERRCCPFLIFVLTIAPDGGPLWPCLTGGGEIKGFLQADSVSRRLRRRRPEPAGAEGGNR